MTASNLHAERIELITPLAIILLPDSQSIIFGGLINYSTIELLKSAGPIKPQLTMDGLDCVTGCWDCTEVCSVNLKVVNFVGIPLIGTRTWRDSSTSIRKMEE